MLKLAWLIVALLPLAVPGMGMAGMPRPTSGPKPQIINGVDVTRADEAAWIASIWYKGRYQCTGIQLANEWILTAAHCVTESPAPNWDRVDYPANEFQYNTGIYNLFNSGWSFAKDVKVHPGYKVEHCLDDMQYWYGCDAFNDFALLKTEYYSFTVVSPPCISTPLPATFDLVRQYGYGLTSPKGDPSFILQSYNTTIVSRQSCEDVGQICHQDKNQISATCGGDSGGPLMSVKDNRLIGIHSIGDCHAKGYLEKASNIETGLEWIQSITNTTYSVYCKK